MRLHEGQIFNNYKELCEYLGERPCGGNAKKAQMRRWREQFDYNMQGHKIIIDQIHDSSILIKEKRGGGNHRGNMDIYLPYIYQCLYRAFPEHQSMTKLICDTFGLFNREALKNLEGKDLKWVKRAGDFVGDNVRTSLERLQKDDLIVYNTAYAFLSQPEQTKYVGYIEGFNSRIEEIEGEMCDIINKRRGISSKISGRQLQFIIFRDKKLAKEYKEGVIQLILGDDTLRKALQDSTKDIFYGVDLGTEAYPIKKYWKVWSVSEIEPPKTLNMKEARDAYINLIIEKGGKISDELKRTLFY